MYEVFDHTADLGLRVRSANLDDLFEDAAQGLFSMLVVNLEAIRAVHAKTYQIPGEQLDYLLFDWLSELLYTFESEQLLLCEFSVHVRRAGLQAKCRGEPMDRLRHQMDHEVKAITYHGLKVEPVQGGWLAELIVDI